MLWRIVLCIVGCLAAFLASTHQMSLAHLPGCDIKNVTRHSQMSSGGQNHPPEPMSQTVTFIWGQAPSTKCQGLLEAVSAAFLPTPIPSPGTSVQRLLPVEWADRKGSQGEGKGECREGKKICKLISQISPSHMGFPKVLPPALPFPLPSCGSSLLLISTIY